MLVRDLPDEVHAQLQRRAEAAGRSLQQYLTAELTRLATAPTMVDVLALPLARFPVGPLMRRAYELRANVTAYDAAYIALAEGLACPLVTGDTRLAAAPGLNCEIEVLAN